MIEESTTICYLSMPSKLSKTLKHEPYARQIFLMGFGHICDLPMSIELVIELFGKN